MNRALIIFTRVPEAGKTKTRLMPYLSGEDCKEIHTAFIKDIVRKQKGIKADCFVWFTPAEKETEIRELIPGAKGYVPQSGENLGERMKRAFDTVFDMGYESAVLTGTDIPQLCREDYEAAFQTLQSHDIAISPTEDGGYYLIGMNRTEDIFKVEHYGTNTVWEDTVRNISEKGLRAGYGKVYRDIDTKEDLEAFAGQLREGEVYAPATEEWLNGKLYSL